MIIGADAVLPTPGIFIFGYIDARINHHPLPGLPAGYIGSDINNFAGSVGTAPVGHFKIEPRPPAPNPDVQKIKRTGAYPNHYLPRTIFRVGHIAVFDHIQIAMCFEI
jgi:hypothetical protein